MGRAKAESAEKHSRATKILEVAAKLFSARGFHATSVRDIVNEVGILPGSLYYHFDSKDELFCAVYREGVTRIARHVETAIAEETDAWARLEAACIAHLEMLLDQSDYARVIIRIVPREIPSIEDRLVAMRAEYEDIFRDITNAISLPEGISSRYFRLQLLGALNYVQTWYRPDGDSPEAIAKGFLSLLRRGAAPTS